MAGLVVTFYSYKGGVGRSFALANVAVILAQWGYRVLAVDWDIEAPRLHHYFAPHVGLLPAGVIDYLMDCENEAPKSWINYAEPVKLPDCGDNLYLMPAASPNGKDFTGTVQALNWDTLYVQHGLGAKIETLRKEWTDDFDFVLIDSRTGVTDFSGLTTAQLPDVLAFMFTANHQSLDGCRDIARRAMVARRKLPIDRSAILPLPIAAKFEQREEYDRAQEWRKRFSERLDEFFRVWAPASIETTRLVDLLTIPYVPRWTFGEELAAAIEPRLVDGPRTTSSPISYPLETLAAVLANRFDKVELLCSSRDEYVMTARAGAQADSSDRVKRIFISYSRHDLPIAQKITQEIEWRGFEVLLDRHSIGGNDRLARGMNDALEKADALLVIVSSTWLQSKWNIMELEQFLRSSLRSDARKPIVPLLLSGGLSSLAGTKLADFAAIRIDPGMPLDRQLEPVFSRLTGAASKPTNEFRTKQVYVYHSQEDLELGLNVARVLRSPKYEPVLPPFDGEADALAELRKLYLLESDLVVLCWGSASEVWVRAALHELRNWKALGRTQPFDHRFLLVGPPASRRKSILVGNSPKSDADIVVDLSRKNLTSPEAFTPLKTFFDSDVYQSEERGN